MSNAAVRDAESTPTHWPSGGAVRRLTQRRKVRRVGELESSVSAESRTRYNGSAGGRGRHPAAAQRFPHGSLPPFLGVNAEPFSLARREKSDP